jgi:2-C-methyl-D-erythritol 4-phosphate cytidylyltransferase
MAEPPAARTPARTPARDAARDAARVAALIPAAGSGERLGRGPKAFIALGGRPLLAWAVASLLPWVDEVVVAVPAADVERARAVVESLEGPRRARVTTGGATRQATVAALLASVATDLVVVHDAARPFLDPATVLAVIAAAREHGACSVGQAVADSLVRRDDGAPVDRATLRAVQTPQAFRRELLAHAHAAAALDGVVATDDAGLVRRLGIPVAWVEGGAHLFKVTTPADLDLAEAVVAAGTFGVRPPAAAPT